MLTRSSLRGTRYPSHTLSCLVSILVFAFSLYFVFVFVLLFVFRFYRFRSPFHFHSRFTFVFFRLISASYSSSRFRFFFFSLSFSILVLAFVLFVYFQMCSRFYFSFRPPFHLYSRFLSSFLFSFSFLFSLSYYVLYFPFLDFVRREGGGAHARGRVPVAESGRAPEVGPANQVHCRPSLAHHSYVSSPGLETLRLG